jgi:thiamine pyrophosphokinase
VGGQNTIRVLRRTLYTVKMIQETFASSTPVLLLGGGLINDQVVDELSNHSAIIAADGGGNYAEARGLDLQGVVGDGDSLNASSPYRQSGLFTCIPDQDSTDFAKALRLIRAPLIVGVGFLEDRLDHALAAISTLAQTTKPVVLVGQSEALVVVRAQQYRLSLPIDTRLSIWPLQSIAFESSQGLMYPLDGLMFAPHTRVGTSNTTSTTTIHITTSHPLEAGYVLMTPWSEYPALRSDVRT